VEWLGLGHTEEEIALLLNCRPGHVRQHYYRELEAGKVPLHARVGGKIVSMALKGDPTMLKFFAKARMGWRDGESSSQGQSLLNIHLHF
jgi:hypothetical protein